MLQFVAETEYIKINKGRKIASINSINHESDKDEEMKSLLCKS